MHVMCRQSIASARHRKKARRTRGRKPMSQTVPAPAPVTEELISARIERLPVTSWYRRMMLIVGTAGFFDAFDALSIAFVMPVLIGLWHITPPQIGALVAIGYLGQLLGAIGFSWLAERLGRRGVL